MRYVGVSRGPAGEVRQDSEEQVNAGRVEVRQARKVGAEFGKDDTESRGTAGGERCDQERKGRVELGHAG